VLLGLVHSKVPLPIKIKRDSRGKMSRSNARRILNNPRNRGEPYNS
jgi:hypothetical protein